MAESTLLIPYRFEVPFYIKNGSFLICIRNMVKGFPPLQDESVLVSVWFWLRSRSTTKCMKTWSCMWFIFPFCPYCVKYSYYLDTTMYIHKCETSHLFFVTYHLNKFFIENKWNQCIFCLGLSIIISLDFGLDCAVFTYTQLNINFEYFN